MSYYAIYKCRLCGKEYDRASAPNVDTVVRHFKVLIGHGAKEFMQVEKTDMHKCVNGDFGLADFQGFVKK